MERKPKYYLNPEGDFVIENYHLAKPFSSFFPGIAGVWGVPIWIFYVNRGQAIASFGIKSKDHPMIEFQPANKSYREASLIGFRTFIKARAGKKVVLYDALHNGVSALGFDIENKMYINSYELKLKEINHTLGLEVAVEYFTIPNDSYAALARKLTLKNITSKFKELEVLDGMPLIIPYGLSNLFLKKLSRTIEAWMQVENLENKIPFLCLKVDPTDRPEIIHISGGNFYLTFSNDGLIKPIVDPEEIFGQVSDFTYPAVFLNKAKFTYPKKQLTRSKTPCCMSYKKLSLGPGEAIDIYSLIGQRDSLPKLNADSCRIANKEYLQNKQAENKKLIQDLQSCVFTHSSSRNFDLYCGQNFLDNIMRGGFPYSIKHSSRGHTHIYVYSRKHGDPERDYNKFLLEPTYFSQGNGNFRDANQNRRSDIWFNPLLKEESILALFSLIQTDGYNPLVIKPDNFLFTSEPKFLDKFFSAAETLKVKERLKKPFTPGELLSFIEHSNIKFLGPREEFIQDALSGSLKSIDAEHGEGFWIDHWTYCLDLLESYLGVYPENLKEILLETKEFTFFDNAEIVRPRKEKYVLKNKAVFQYHALTNNHAKSIMIKKREVFPHLSRAGFGQGQIYKTSLIVKMLTVIANKFAGFDPFGIGLEMEADKPNWYDSLNGLPGLLGSSTCETFELKRWIMFLRESLKTIGLSHDYEVSLPIEVYDLLLGLNGLFKDDLDEYGFWDKSHTLKEDYRQRTVMGFSGNEKEISGDMLNPIFENFLRKIESGLKKAYDEKQGLYWSYFINEVSDYEVISSDGEAQFIQPLKFRQIPLPLFLEGVMHSLRVIENPDDVRRIFQAVRKSALFDRKLKMYKVTAPLKDMPEEIGRCRVFTPGWLENESIWLHMEYKYVLELLKQGLYKEFFEDFKNVLIPFQDPGRYGRSILENSSFLVSSAFPQEKLHGNGFVARLSGSTSEFINIWLIMCLGQRPFYLDNDSRLCLEFSPLLPAWLFSRKDEMGFDKNTFAFKFLTNTLVVYHNPKMKDTFGPSGVKVSEITLKQKGKADIFLKSAYIGSPLAKDIREGKFERIDISLG